MAVEYQVYYRGLGKRLSTTGKRRVKGGGYRFPISAADATERCVKTLGEKKNYGFRLAHIAGALHWSLACA